MEFNQALFSTAFLWLTSPTSWAYILGIIVSLVYMDKYRTPCLFLLMGCFLNLITLFITNFGLTYLPIYLEDQGHVLQDIRPQLRIFAWLMGLVHFGGFVLILLAVFSGRKKTAVHS